ncbi:MAG: 4'-phosphopantetheinyl transferase superfamily protein, partial [Oscillospiraceae bacterium]|nr:4'-phosphopantetheinyl transferase superfamily protein [Oscillospiraceae bacterium]
LCALSDAPVGVDVEVVRPRRPGLPAYVLSEVEREEFDGSWEDFYRLWTRKESWCKREDAPLYPPREAAPPQGCCAGFEGEGWRGAVCCHGAPPEEVVWLEAGELPGLRDS